MKHAHRKTGVRQFEPPPPNPPRSLTQGSGFNVYPDTWNSTSAITPLGFKMIDWNFEMLAFM